MTTIARLSPEHATAISAAVKAVYGSGYAHELFYDVALLQDALKSGRLKSVGALTPDGQVLAHMAMTGRGDQATPELGNTLVDPTARGGGLAWQVGAELTTWCKELGHSGFLHYPTTEHHIMQRQSVKSGIETGVMLSYIPETDNAKRVAATIVYEPFNLSPRQMIFVPSAYQTLIEAQAHQCQIQREIHTGQSDASSIGRYDFERYAKRQLARLTVYAGGSDLAAQLLDLKSTGMPCLHVDLVMSCPNIEASWATARESGFVLAGWLPGFQVDDVLRLQRWDAAATEAQPNLVNEQAQALYSRALSELADS